MDVDCATCHAGLTAWQAILLADDALKAGRVETAERYVTAAFAILDAAVARDRSSDGTAHLRSP